MNVTRATRVLAVVCVGVAAYLPSSASGSPGAEAARSCRSVTTLNGGHANFINTSGRGATCRAARRVARRAKGRRYTALGFTCTPRGRYSSTGRLYGCGGVINGQARGIGFYYKRPGDD